MCNNILNSYFIKYMFNGDWKPLFLTSFCKTRVPKTITINNGPCFK